MVLEDGKMVNEYKLISGNSYAGWKKSFKKYPLLVKQVEEILLKNRVDQNTIDSLTVTSLWKISPDSRVLAFDLYLLRSVNDIYHKSNFANVTSLSIIAKKDNKKWLITIVDAIFDVDIEMDVRFRNGHAKYQIWDLYESFYDDSYLKVLYKVEGKDEEYFELFVEQPNGKYVSVYKGGGYNIDNY